jgi:hypothetical protein
MKCDEQDVRRSKAVTMSPCADLVDRLGLLEERQKTLTFELKDLSWRYQQLKSALEEFDKELCSFDLALQARLAQEDRGMGRH